jgi:hypothetical protein
MRQRVIYEAIEKAKSNRWSREHDQIVPRDQVQMIELVLAYESLLSSDGADPSKPSGPDPQTVVLDALINQDLIAVTFGDDAIVPVNVWETDRAWNEGPYHSAFWSGWLQYLDERGGDDPFEGRIPVIPRAKAESWLLKKMKGAGVTGAPKILGVKQAYEDLYPDGHKAVNATWKKVSQEVGSRIGRPVSIDTIKRSLGLRE